VEGKPNLQVRVRSSKYLPFVFIFFLAFFVDACARHKIALERPSFPPERKGVYHVVERHQTLYRICRTYGADIKEVSSINGIVDPSKIKTGQRIFIPGAEKVLKVEIYLDDVVTEPIDKGKIAFKELDFIWPLTGRCVDFFEETERRRHQGIDISTPAGTPIKASGPGVVIYSGNKIRGYGNLIILRHSDEFVSVYAHNQENLVEEGMRVERGQMIGRVGQTGRASGPHLHFEIRKKNKAMDPLLFLK
jgi:murein DD-endopeptidase MepM/ murein hydrolase activator NlpD